MKKLLLSLLALVSVLSMSAVTFTMSEFGADFVAAEGITSDGYTFVCAKNNGGTAPAFNTTYLDVRLYAKNSLTITSETPMTSISFVISTQGKKRLTEITCNEGTVATQALGDEYVNWTGEATSVTFTVGEKAIYGSDGESKAGQFDFTEIFINEEVIENPDPVENGVDNIEAFLNGQGEMVITNPVTAVYQSGIYLYVKDETGWLLVYGSLSGKEYKNGDVIPAGIKGTLSPYAGLPEMKPMADSFGTPTAGTPIKPVVTTISAIANAELNSYVKIENVTVGTPNGKTTVITDGEGNTINLYNNFGTVVAEGENVTVEGFVATFNETRQIYPTALSNSGDVPEEDAANIAEWVKLASAAPAAITNPVTAVYQNGQRLYIKDNSGWLLVYGNVGKEYKNGDVIPAGIKGTYQLYNGAAQMSTPLADTFGEATAGTPVAPTPTMLADVNAEPVHSYIEISNVKVAEGEKGGRYFDMISGDDTVVLYNQFDIEVPTGDDMLVRGIISVYKEVYQVYPLEVVDLAGIEGVAVDNNAPAVYYNLQGVRVNNPAAGLFIKVQGNKISKVLVK